MSRAAGAPRELDAPAEPGLDDGQMTPVPRGSVIYARFERICPRLAKAVPFLVFGVTAILLVVFRPLRSVLFSGLAALALAAVLYCIYLAATDPRRLARESTAVSTRTLARVETLRDTIAAEHRRAEEARKPKPLSDVQALLQGATFTKYGRSRTPHPRWVWLRLRGSALEVCWAESSRSRKPGCLPIGSVVDIVVGRQTEVFQRHRLSLPGEDRAFSLLSDSRSLDLEAANAQIAQLWVTTLRDLVTKHRQSNGTAAVLRSPGGQRPDGGSGSAASAPPAGHGQELLLRETGRSQSHGSSQAV